MSDEFPAGWSRTISDVVSEAVKSGKPTDPRETAWALAYERSLLRPWARFPKHGDCYEALEDTPVRFLTHWRAPFTDGGDGVLPKEARIRVEVFDFNPEPVGVYARPIEAERLEKLLVAESVRHTPKYNGFSLLIPTADLNTKFRLVPD